MMKNRGEITVLGILVTAVAIIVGFTWHHFSHKNDTPVEEMAEAVIEHEVGIKVDFSAEDKEETAQKAKDSK